MQNKKTIGYVVLVIVIAAIAFYGGMSMSKSKTSSTPTSNFAQGGNISGAFARRGGTAGGADAGTIIAKDAQSITLQLSSGGSKIIFYTPTTSVQKTTAGSTADFVIGENVNVFGTANSDGSISAQSVQIRPAMSLGAQNGWNTSSAPMIPAGGQQ